MEQKGKVYVNPNFKPKQPTQHSRMYVNPLFSNHLSNIHQLSNASLTKIHVNPNFIRSNIAISSVQSQHKFVRNENNTIQNPSFTNQGRQTLPEISNNIVQQNKSRYSFVRQNNSNKSNQVHKHDQTPCTSVSSYSSYQPPKPSVTVTKYSLVRSNQNQDIKVIPKETTMIKINKYKSVAVQNIRKTFDTPSSSHTPTLKRHLLKLRVSITTKPSSFINKYKYVNTNISLKQKVLKRPVNRKLSVSIFKKQHLMKNKIDKKQFKINNIPCPLFRKFGKCIRNDRGTCEFLHDKNQVSICRRYLSGSCHDRQCLLSHDISLKKMPTCSFYLRGMCTKENCPYLHVKLNMKTKICTEFLKGFCENGDNCLYRHENVCPNFVEKGVCFNKQCPYPHKSTASIKLSRSVKLRAIKPKLGRKSDGNLTSNKRNSIDKQNKDTNIAETRYYANIDRSETSEMIKPMRTKLGNLPSFIQL